MKLLTTLLLLSSTVLAQTSLPQFSFTGTNGSKITKESLPSNQPVLVFYYDPYCDHCTQQAQLIKNELQSFEGTTQLWVTTDPGDVQEFKNQYFGGAKNIFFATDSDFMFDSYFGYSEVMSIYVYDKNHQLVKKLENTTPVKDLVGLVD